MIKTLLIDIETAPALAYIWGLKTRYIPLSRVVEDGHVLCFAAGWLGEPHLEFYSRWDDGEEEMVRRAWELLDEADAIIHYNGNNFDIPRLNVEFLQYRLGPPSPSHQIDLFQTTRKFRVLSRSMNHMLRLLDLDLKLEHKGMELWTQVMAGDKQAQRTMRDYNIQDVEVMEQLYHELLPWIDNHPNVGLWMAPGQGRICPNCGSTKIKVKGYKRTRVLSYRQYQCRDCGSYPRERFAEETGRQKREDILR